VNEDLVDANADFVLESCYKDHHRLPTQAECALKYKSLLKVGRINNPLPDGWQVTWRQLEPRLSYSKTAISIEVRAGGSTFKHIEDIDTR